MENNIQDIEDIFGFPKVKREREEVPANEDFTDRMLDVAEVMKDTDKTPSVSDLDLIEETQEKVEVEVVELDETIFGEIGDEDPDIPDITASETPPETVYNKVDSTVPNRTPVEEGPLDEPLPEKVDDGMDAILGIETTESTKTALEKTLANQTFPEALANNARVSQTAEVKEEIILDTVKENEQLAEEQTQMAVAEKDMDEDDKASAEMHGDGNDLPEGEITWITSSESAKFDYFYKQKISIIKQLLRGKQLPFAEFEHELRNSYCETGSNIYDLPQLYKNMTNVQRYRDRVCQIQSDVNSQYYKWDRTVELLRGVLARTQYERGKQEGIQFEHLRDMELYLESLKSIHKTADIIHKNLDAAFDLLSRQVTISQNDKPIDRNESSYNSNVSSSHPTETCTEKETSGTLTDYDDLPVSGGTVAIGPKVKKKSVQGVKIKSWDEM
jgi:hypothetical protein